MPATRVAAGAEECNGAQWSLFFEHRGAVALGFLLNDELDACDSGRMGPQRRWDLLRNGSGIVVTNRAGESEASTVASARSAAA
jgi:hypothetical protein